MSSGSFSLQQRFTSLYQSSIFYLKWSFPPWRRYIVWLRALAVKTSGCSWFPIFFMRTMYALNDQMKCPLSLQILRTSNFSPFWIGTSDAGCEWHLQRPVASCRGCRGQLIIWTLSVSEKSATSGVVEINDQYGPGSCCLPSTFVVISCVHCIPQVTTYPGAILSVAGSDRLFPLPRFMMNVLCVESKIWAVSGMHEKHLHA